MKTKLALGILMVLTACGGRTSLQPKPGASLPPKPISARVQPTPEQLMTSDTQSRPQRTDELLRRSEERRSDRFDLPPPG